MNLLFTFVFWKVDPQSVIAAKNFQSKSFERLERSIEGTITIVKTYKKIINDHKFSYIYF